jgi:hypothetical protein
MANKNVLRTAPCSSQAGMSLIETVIALGLLFTASVGVMTMATVAMTTTENQGHLAARTAEYAQDKMEQLISLSYGDTTSDTRVFPSASSGGTGLVVGGNSNPSAATTGYVDYLDRAGNPLAIGASAPATWFYVRAWQISTPTGTTNLKQITVTTRVRSGVGSKGTPPQATVVSLKTSPF